MTAVILVWRDFDRLPSVGFAFALCALLSLLHETAIYPVHYSYTNQQATMADDEDIAALVIDNGSGMCKGTSCCGAESKRIDSGSCCVFHAAGHRGQ